MHRNQSSDVASYEAPQTRHSQAPCSLFVAPVDVPGWSMCDVLLPSRIFSFIGTNLDFLCLILLIFSFSFLFRLRTFSGDVICVAWGLSWVLFGLIFGELTIVLSNTIFESQIVNMCRERACQRNFDKILQGSGRFSLLNKLCVMIWIS